jgi:hypothetical protein
VLAISCSSLQTKVLRAGVQSHNSTSDPATIGASVAAVWTDPCATDRNSDEIVERNRENN